VNAAADDGEQGDGEQGDSEQGGSEQGGEEQFEAEVPALVDGMRIDRVVAMLTGAARSEVATLVAAGAVILDGRVVTQRSALVAAGSRLSVRRSDPRADRPRADDSVPFAVVFEDDDVVVVDKPAGLVVHPGSGRREGTLVHGLLARFPDLEALALAGVCEPDRPGIVHRLDKGTSGLLVVARTEPAYRSLVEQLAAHTVDRRYVALVHGHVDDERGVIDAPIGRSNRTPTRMAVTAAGREARTAYRVLARVSVPAVATVLSVSLETGRTHQIRVHLNAIGHPVVGDTTYAPRRGFSGLPAGRVFLHAYGLSFTHPTTGERRSFRAALPADLAAVCPQVPDLAGLDGSGDR
jgi:23S rRNA pseudouridine1911/1915/1917 synthase